MRTVDEKQVRNKDLEMIRNNLKYIKCAIVILIISFKWTVFSVSAVDPSPQNMEPCRLIASSFLGGGGAEAGWPTVSIVRDPTDHFVIAGHTASNFFPVTPGVFDETHNGSTDIFVARLCPDLSSLTASTYVGGSGADRCFSIALDDQGNIYVLGNSNSSDFPTTPGGFDTTHNGGSDIVVFKLDGTLENLLYASYMGGSGAEEARTIRIDGEGACFLSGITNSVDFPTTAGAYDETFNGSGTWNNGDTFVCKMDDELATLLASTFLGGEEDELHGFITLDESGQVFVTGSTQSADYPTTTGAFDESFNGGLDLFLSRLDNDLTDLTASTLAGGNGNDWGYDLVHEASGSVFVVGHAAADYPVTPGAYDETYNGGPYGDDDVVISRFDVELTTLMASSFLGGDNEEYATSMSLDQEDNVCIAGYTRSTNFPVTAGAFDDAHNGGYDGFIARMDGHLCQLSASGYLGGSGAERDVRVISLDSGFVTLAGTTLSTDFPTHPNSYDTTYNGGKDVFLSKLAVTGLTSVSDILSANIGGSVDFQLVAGTENANRNFLIVGTVSGTSPGMTLPGGKILPINWDIFSDIEILLLNTAVFHNFLGILDSEGCEDAALNAPPLPSSSIGLIMDFAYTCNKPFDHVSNPLGVEITP